MTGKLDDLGLPPFFHAPERGIHRCVSQRQAPVNVKSWQATGHPLRRRMSVVLDADWVLAMEQILRCLWDMAKIALENQWFDSFGKPVV